MEFEKYRLAKWKICIYMDPMCTLKKREGNSELFLKSQGIPLDLNSNYYL